VEAADEALAGAIDGAVADSALEARPPGSILWPVIGLLQLAAAAVLLFVVAWYVTLFLLPGGDVVASVELPVLGPLPMPLVLLAGSLIASVLLGALLSLHAGWIGRRFAARVVTRVRERVAAAVEQDAFGPLDRVEAARGEIAAALPRQPA
jgi:ABC-type multidrug transport system fused ATPase/permease subunit